MTPRAQVAKLGGLPKPANAMTLREAVEWYKKAVRGLEDYAPLSAKERGILDTSWFELCQGIGLREGFPWIPLSSLLGQRAQQEMALLEAAEEESAVARMEGQAFVESG